MKTIKSYSNTVNELNILKERYKLISKYEQNLATEKNEISNLICLYKKVVDKMEKDIQKLQGIENKLYYEIVIKGNGITKAIDKIAGSEYIDVSTLWKNYYPKIKPDIEKLYLLISNKNKD